MGYLPWTGGRGTYFGQGGGVPTLDRGRGTYLGVPLSHPDLARGGGVPALNGGRGTYLGVPSSSPQGVN